MPRFCPPSSGPTPILAPILAPTLAPIVALVLAATAQPAAANDGFGGLSATGLHFAQTDAVAMESEDLFIGPDRISVDYVFRNLTGHDVTGEVIFPLPPISLEGMWQGAMMNLPESPVPENLVNFSVTVDGIPVTPAIDRIAVIEPDWSEDRDPAAQYDTPGRDVTAIRRRHGLPLLPDLEAASAALMALPAAARAELVADGLAAFHEDEAWTDLPAEPRWSVVQRYHWSQTFPAGAVVRVHHEYDNLPPGGLFMWEHPVSAGNDWLLDYRDRYCIDDETSRALARVLHQDGGTGWGTAFETQYVLVTANSWAGPIGHFRLTLDKGDAGNIISLCASGVNRTGPTTFVVERSDYTPTRDLDILLVVPPSD